MLTMDASRLFSVVYVGLDPQVKSMVNVPLMLDNLAEAVEHAIVVIGARSLAGLQLTSMFVSNYHLM